MPVCGGICGIEITCPHGCIVFCTTDCTDCTQGCEPTTLGVPLQITRIIRTDKDIRFETSDTTAEDAPAHAGPAYDDTTDLRFSFQDASRASIAQVLATMSHRKVQVAKGREHERISASGTATLAELAVAHAFQLEG